MRPFLGFVTLLLTISSSAEVVAGRRFILINDAWAPSGGGPITSLGAPAESAAFDGDRFLTAWRDGDALRMALFEEGAVTPVAETSVDAPRVDAPVVRWDGNRYVVAAGGHPGVLAIVSASGIVESTTPLDATEGLVDLAASASGIALLLHYSTPSYSGVVDVVLLNSGYQVAIRRTVGSIVQSTGFGATWISTPRLAPFGARFYAVWREARAGGFDNLMGTVIELNGSAAAGTRVETEYSYPSPSAVFLHPYGPRVVVNAVRPWSMGLTSTLVEQNGTLTLVARLDTTDLPEIATLRMFDGGIAAIYVRDGVATIKPLLPALPARRRSARH